MSTLLSEAQNDPDYWTGVKYYIKNDLRDAWEIQDNDYLAWAGECAQHIPRATMLLNDLMQDMSFSTQQDIERHLDYSERYHLETHDALLGYATAFSLEFVKQVAGRLSPEKIEKCRNLTIYRTMEHNNVDAMEYFDSVLDLDLRTLCARFYFHDMIEAAQNLEVYLVKKTLVQTIDDGSHPTVIKKL